MNPKGLEEMKGIKRFVGLILKDDDHKPIMFRMKTPKFQTIHSIWCPPFIAHWYLKGEKIGEQYVPSGEFKIDPPGEWDSLIEVPVNYLKGGEKQNGIQT